MSDDHSDDQCPIHGIHADGMEITYNTDDESYSITMTLMDDDGERRPVASVTMPVKDAEAAAEALNFHAKVPGSMIQ